MGWTRGGFYTRTLRGGTLLLRSATGAPQATLARHVSTYSYDNTSGSLYYIANDALVRADGGTQRPIASLRELGFSTRGYLQLQPLGPLVVLEGAHRLVALDSNGALFASTRLPPALRNRSTANASALRSASAVPVLPGTAVGCSIAPAKGTPPSSTRGGRGMRSS